MDWTHYRFRTLWSLPLPPAAVYEALARPDGYPRWWPQVRTVTRLNETTGVFTIRSVLPYDMTFTARETHRDPAAGVVEVIMSGDIQGWACWTVTPDGPRTKVRYDQIVEVNKPLLRWLAVPGRLVFRVNHRLMMASGRRGLLRHLAAV